MPRPWLALPLISVLVAFLLALRASATAHVAQQSPRIAVSIENYSYSPDPLTVAVGATVIWTNRDEVAHNVVSRDHLFTSPDLEVNQHFEFTFKKAGRFDYFCSIHPEMTGRVVVK